MRNQRVSTTLGGLLVAIGVALVVRTATAGADGVAIGYVLGVGIAITGAARIWLARKGL
jgi:hypothetical protein